MVLRACTSVKGDGENVKRGRDVGREIQREKKDIELREETEGIWKQCDVRARGAVTENSVTACA